MQNISRTQRVTSALSQEGIVFVHGPSGSGKSYAIRKALQGTKTLFTTAQDICVLYLAWLNKKVRQNDWWFVWKKYRVVVIEDVDLGLCGKEYTQKDVRNALLLFTQHGKKAVLTSVYEPTKLAHLMNELPYTAVNFMAYDTKNKNDKK